MKCKLFPIHITLSKLSEEGSSFVYDSHGGQLDQGLNDLIGSNSYELKFFIQPIRKNAYELCGHIKTQMELLCSLCASDLKWDINESINEILLVECDKRSQISRKTRVNYASELADPNLFCNILSSDEFSVLNFAHEIIALAEPHRPLGHANCEKKLCPNLTTETRLKLAEFQDVESQDRDPYSPFSVLAEVKVPHLKI